MTIDKSTSLLSKSASLKLLTDMLKQAEEDKKTLLEALEECVRGFDSLQGAHSCSNRQYADQARDAIEKVARW